MICCEEEMIREKFGFKCQKCGKTINDIEIIKQAFIANPDINAIDLARITEIPSNVIIRYLNDGTLSSIEIKKKKNMRGYYMGSPDAEGRWRTDIPNKYRRNK